MTARGSLPDQVRIEDLDAWLGAQPHAVVSLITARAALRLAPLALAAAPEEQVPHAKLKLCRALASSWLAHRLANQEDRREFELAMTAAAAGVSEVSGAVETAARHAAHRAATQGIASAAHICRDNRGSADMSGVIASTVYAAEDEAHGRGQRDADPAIWAAVGAIQADVNQIREGIGIDGLAVLPLWQGTTPEFHVLPRQLPKSSLLDAAEGWEVWTDWYDARLRGDKPDWEMERARILLHEEVWEQGPKAVNAEIARRIAAHVARKPQGERLDLVPPSLRVGILPAELDDPDAVANAVSIVEDALSDFRASSVANRAFVLNSVLRKLDRAVENHRDNPRRLHDDFSSAARSIAFEIEKDDEIDELPVRDLRDACAQGAIDIRIGVKAVSDMEADRRRRQARAPSENARSAVRRLLDEQGQLLEPDLREEMREDLETIEAINAADGEPLPEGDARDADIRLANRLAWLYRFSRFNQAQIDAMAQRLGRSIDDIEWVVTMIRSVEAWSDLIMLIFRSV